MSYRDFKFDISQDSSAEVEFDLLSEDEHKSDGEESLISELTSESESSGRESSSSESDSEGDVQPPSGVLSRPPLPNQFLQNLP